MTSTNFIADAEKKLQDKNAAPAGRSVGYKLMEGLSQIAQDEFTQRNIIIYLLSELHKKVDKMIIHVYAELTQIKRDNGIISEQTERNRKEVPQQIDRLIDWMNGNLKSSRPSTSAANISVSDNDIDKLAEKLSGMAISGTGVQSNLFFTEKDY